MSWWSKLFQRPAKGAEKPPPAKEIEEPEWVTEVEGPQPTYGYTAEDPILCHRPRGERDFLHGLLCPNGHPLRGSRAGSCKGECPDPDGHVAPFGGCLVDRYELVCDGGEHSCTLYFDMYHPSAADPPIPQGLSRGDV